MQTNRAFASVAAALLFSSLAYAADTYNIGPAHTSIGFSVRHLGLNNVKGQFKESAGAILLDHAQTTEASGTIRVKSVDTGVQQRDDHLRTPDFFDAVKYPTITFKTKHTEMTGGQLIMIADFTMRGVTRELRLPAKLAGPAKDPWGNLRIGLEAKTKLNRKDYGINYHQVLDVFPGQAVVERSSMNSWDDAGLRKAIEATGRKNILTMACGRRSASPGRRSPCSRAALRACGYTKDTPNPPAGEIQRDARGNRTGLLIARPSAGILYATVGKQPKLPPEHQMNSSRHFMRELHRLGLTSLVDAGGGAQIYPDDYAIIEELHRGSVRGLL